MDDLFELLCSDSVLMYDYETAETMLRTLEDKAEGESSWKLIGTSYGDLSKVLRGSQTSRKKMEDKKFRSLGSPCVQV